jgi:GNAT superfamily N-acetyltransferase
MDEPEPPASHALIFRPVVEGDWPALTAILRQATAARDALTYDAELTDSQLRELWGASQRVLVAQAPDGAIAATAKIGRNQGGPGDHVATASFVVAPAWRCRGVGRQLCRHVLAWTRDAGFAAIQFNAVVASNVAAVNLWQSEGFQIVGRVPHAFCHPRLGFVDLLVMHREISEGRQ